MQLRHAARTDTGKRYDHNEDSYGVETGSERAAAGSLFVVCDGIGGYASGEVASDLAVKTIIAQFYAARTPRPEAALGMAFEEANRVVFKEGGGKIGTTGVAAFFKDDAVIVANVGDCRAYLVRNGQIRQITKDHSFVREQIDAGMLTEQQARESSYRNIITRALGNRADVEIDLFREPLLEDDVIVLCSDGLHGQVEPEEIALAVTKVPLDQACAALVKRANDNGGPDNITIVAIKVLELTFRADRPDERATPLNNPVAKTERLVAHSATAALPAAQPASSQASASDTGYTGADRRSGVDRRAGGSVERRATGQTIAPPSTAPVRSNPARSFLLWMVALLLIAVLVFGGYFYFLGGGGPTLGLPTGGASAAPAPATQTPLGERPTPTPVATPRASAATSGSAAPAP